MEQSHKFYGHLIDILVHVDGIGLDVLVENDIDAKQKQLAEKKRGYRQIIDEKMTPIGYQTPQ